MADPGLKMELVTQRFDKMLEELANIDSSVEFGDVVRSEAGSVAANATRNTIAASVAKINAQKFTTFNGKTYYIDRNYRNAALRAAMEQVRPVKRAARGMAKQSWVSIGRSLGTPIKAPAYVLSANYKGQQYPEDGTSMVEGSGTGVTVTIYNSSPYITRIGGAWALLGAMSARASYFERNMAHHAFLTIETRAKKYPGIFTDPVPPAAGVDLDAA